MHSPRQGFTLFELVLVVTLLVILAGVSFPSLQSMYGGFKVTAAADEVRAAWAQARAHAINEGTPYRFAVVPNHGNYRVAPDEDGYWAGHGTPEHSGDPGQRPLVLEEALPKGVRFSTDKAPAAGGGDTVLPPGSVSPSQWTTVAVFLPDGTAREDVEIVFLSRGARPLVLKLRGLTGTVTSPRKP
jgi:prepilin-type N-terminal cleavage/methylation domain-containing protein